MMIAPLLPSVIRSSPASGSTRQEPGTAERAGFEGRAGFTLIEAMVSLLILSVILLGLHTGMVTAITMNTENLLRNEAVKLAQERMDKYRIEPSSDIPGSDSVTRQVRNSNVTYTLDNNYDDSTNILDMTVEWEFQNEQHSLEYTSHVGG